ncbi:MAG: cation transporter [Clostridia bacterium]|nr:cation transporter [Clostridia bacterium]
MTYFILKVFAKDDYNTPENRTKVGNIASVIGIICNLLLTVIKGLAGIFFNSVAILADAVNNLSDAGNSLISFFGFLISGKPADNEHPYGHARIEYISCMLISFFIMILGINLLKTSIIKIIYPEETKITLVTIFILIFSIIIKIWLGFFYKKTGIIINSDVLLANSTDSFNDVISTSAVLFTSVITLFFNISLDAYAGCAVAIFIIYSGIKILNEVISNLIGTMPDPALTNQIKNKLNSYSGVMGIHDLIVHSYGYGKHFATVHVEVPFNADILTSHEMIDNIERDFLTEMNINLVIHLDPVITDDKESIDLKNKIELIVKQIHKDFSIHDFRMIKGETYSKVIFDVVMPDEYKSPEKEIKKYIINEVKKIDNNLSVIITIDKNYIKI